MKSLEISGRKDEKSPEDKCGKTQILGLQGYEAVSPQELLARLTEAQAGRATRATQVNERLGDPFSHAFSTAFPCVFQRFPWFSMRFPPFFPCVFMRFPCVSIGPPRGPTPSSGSSAAAAR